MTSRIPPTPMLDSPELSDGGWLLTDSGGNRIALIQGHVPNGSGGYTVENWWSCIQMPYAITESPLTTTFLRSTYPPSESSWNDWACTLLSTSSRYSGSLYKYTIKVTAYGTQSCP